MTSIYQKLAVAAAGAVVSFAAIPSGEALAQKIGDIGVPQEPGASFGQSVSSGDFLYTRSGQENTLGNGIDEAITWLFDFNDDENLLDFLAEDGDLTDASFNLIVRPQDGKITTDRVGTPGTGLKSSATVKGRVIRVTQDLFGGVTPVVGEDLNIGFNLLEHGFTSQMIMKNLESDEANKYPGTDAGLSTDYWPIEDRPDIPNKVNALPFLYYDDSIMVSASVTLSKQNASTGDIITIYSEVESALVAVPEPSTIAGLSVVGLGLLLKNKKKQS